jgi:tetratricopeptide (TPR) repeat protein
MPLADWLKFVPPPRPLEANEKWNVFLSYRSANRAWVLNLYDVLRVHGHQVFIDQCVLAAGDELITQLQDALKKSQSGVLVWSNATRDSKWVSREYQVMERMTDTKPSFRFVPVRLDSSEVPEFAGNRIFLDFQAYPDGPNGGELLRLLHAVVGAALSPEAARFALEQDELSAEASAQIAAAIKHDRSDRLVELFEKGGLAWESSATLGGKVAEGLTKLGKYDLALDVLDKLSRQFPKAIRPKQLRALALNRRARDGAATAGNDINDAQEILGILYERGERDPETLGIYGATWMERYKRSKDARHLRQSRDLYMEAFDTAQDDYYTGINAASKSVFLGGKDDLETGATLATRVQKIVGTEPRKGDYWFTATIGEVFLIRKQYAEAARLYAAAVATAPSEVGSHKSTWAQACALMEKLEPGADERALIRSAFAHLPDC